MKKKKQSVKKLVLAKETIATLLNQVTGGVTNYCMSNVYMCTSSENQC